MQRKILIVILTVFVAGAPVYACTSFAVYFDEPIYGKNLDLYGTDVTIRLQEYEGTTIFQFSSCTGIQCTVGIC